MVGVCIDSMNILHYSRVNEGPGSGHWELSTKIWIRMGSLFGPLLSYSWY